MNILCTDEGFHPKALYLVFLLKFQLKAADLAFFLISDIPGGWGWGYVKEYKLLHLVLVGSTKRSH